MKKNELDIYYDEEGDLLELRIGEPKSSYYEEIEDGIFERIDEKTKEIKGFAVFSFRKRIKLGKDIKIPLPVNVQIIPNVQSRI
ncbi:hypothetical protein CL617_03310 [archaeon]|nr:hypothetical protein [archaeon]|tara:strand:- start:5011 stop:5262 length:252 start_codon:yes stop_codon:yes gene_type:complete